MGDGRVGSVVKRVLGRVGRRTAVVVGLCLAVVTETTCGGTDGRVGVGAAVVLSGTKVVGSNGSSNTVKLNRFRL